MPCPCVPRKVLVQMLLEEQSYRVRVPANVLGASEVRTTPNPVPPTRSNPNNTALFVLLGCAMQLLAQGPRLLADKGVGAHLGMSCPRYPDIASATTGTEAIKPTHPPVSSRIPR